MTIKSVLIWPEEIYLGWHSSAENKSEDTHHSQAAAESVCMMLIRKGFGCNGEVFPLNARVEIDGEVVWQWED